MIPCLIFEDEHLLAVNKPAGLNTHAPHPHAGEGIYDWLKHREPRWAALAVIHRLDKETSGVLVFGKTALANRSLTEQFTARSIRKKYLLLTSREPNRRDLVVKSKIARAGEKYISTAHGEPAETRFHGSDLKSQIPNSKFLEAEPVTGRTHQIRVHAAENGFPILGDTLYGGAAFTRVCLHAAELRLRHPAGGAPLTFRAPVDFGADVRAALRAALIDPRETDCFRAVHGASDGWPDWYVDRLGDYLLSQSECPAGEEQKDRLRLLVDGETGAMSRAPRLAGAYHKILSRQVRRATIAEASPKPVIGDDAPERFTVHENGMRFELSFSAGYSVGLFLDQRDNRRRLLTGHIAADFPLFDAKSKTQNSTYEVLNAFAYTCGFSVCAAKAGAKTTSLDLSKKYLEWGRRNFALNGLDPAGHDFIYGDVFDWLRRLARKGRRFDVVLFDPPTFSQSSGPGTFRVEKDYADLVRTALPLLKPGGILFASTNAAGWPPEKFLAAVEAGIREAKRKILQTHYVPQPPDFPISRSEPAYLKTVWLRVGPDPGRRVISSPDPAGA